MKNPRVSVVIPVHNSGATLNECLDSVLSQTYKDYEVIVVDNNSGDKTKSVINEFMCKSNKIRYVFEPIVSRGASRKKGFEESKGKIIVMTDGDCVVPSNWLNDLICPIVKKGEEIVQGGELPIFNNYWTKSYQLASDFNVNRNIYGGHYVDILDTKNFAVRREILLDLGGFNENVGNLEDFELKIKVNKKGYKIYFLDDLEVKHNHKNSFIGLFRNRIDQGYWAAYIYRNNRDYFKNNSDELVELSSLKGVLKVFYSLNNLLFKHSFKLLPFLLVTGIGWRIGTIKFFLDNI